MSYRGRGDGSLRRGRGGRGRGGPSVRGRGFYREGPPQEDLSSYDQLIPHEELPEDHGRFEQMGASKYLNRNGFATKYESYITLVTNHFRITLSDNPMKQKVYHYDVEIEPINRNAGSQGSSAQQPGNRRTRKLSFKINQKIINEVIAGNSRSGKLFWDENYNRPIIPVFDGRKNIYTVCPLGIIGTDPGENVRLNIRLQIEDEPADTQYNVRVQVPGGENDYRRCELDLNEITQYYNGDNIEMPDDLIQALNIIIRYGPALTRIPIGINALYPRDDQREDLGSGKEMIYGHYQSVRPGSSGLNLIVDRTATAFLPNLGPGESIIGFVKRLLNQRQFDSSFRNHQYSLQRVESELRKASFYVTHNGYKKTLKKLYELDDRPADRIFFDMDGQQISVKDYFQNRFPSLPRLKYPELPVMNFGSRERGNFIPMEYVFLVEDQHASGKLDANQTSQMIRFTATEPIRRFQNLLRSNYNIKKEGSKYLQEFEIDISLNPLLTVGKILSPPPLQYGNNKMKDTHGGKWDMKDMKVFRAGFPINKWVAYNFTRRDIMDPLQTLMRMGINMGLTLSNPIIKQIPMNQPNEFINHFNSLPEAPDMIFWVQPPDDKFYQKMKQFCEVSGIGGSNQNQKGFIVSQCCLESNFMKNSPQTMANIILKINTKMGGINQILFEKPPILNSPNVLIVGADVTHSAPADITDQALANIAGTRFEASIAAVVSSLDNEYYNYHVEIKIQMRERQEIIKEFGNMFEGCLKSYYKKNKTLPKRIVFYRDGVSEGQFDQVLGDELTKMKQTCIKIGQMFKIDYKPAITFIIVQKRHHTRFRPKNIKDGIGRHNNVPPGTLVDTDIVHPRDYDYYLASHEGIQGTSKPSHYYVLKDDNKLNANHLYKLTFYLCHTYAKATRSISIPSPVMYAHLAALRARHYLSAAASRRQVRQQENRELSAQECQRICDHLNSKISTDKNLSNSMFFC